MQEWTLQPHVHKVGIYTFPSTLCYSLYLIRPNAKCMAPVLNSVPHRLPFLSGTMLYILSSALLCLLALLLPPRPSRDRLCPSLPPSLLCSCARKSEMKVRSCCISVAADPWLSQRGRERAQAVLGPVRMKRLFAWRAIPVRTLSRSLGRILPACLNMQLSLAFIIPLLPTTQCPLPLTAPATPDRFSFLQILPMHDPSIWPVSFLRLASEGRSFG